MISVSTTAESRHASLWQLCLVFVLTMLLFSVLRWQPEPWLQNRIDRQVRHSGIDLQYGALHIEGLTVRLKQVSIRTGTMPAPLMLDSLRISPAWSSLLSGSVAVDMQAELSGQSVSAVLVWQDKYIGVHDLNAVVDVAVLQTLWKQRMPLPVNVGGGLKLSGNVQLGALSGLPVEGQLDAVWQQASIDLPMFDKPLGDYHLALKADANASGIWQWLLGGGDAVTLSGSGQMDMSGNIPQQWTINGRVQLRSAPEAKAIVAMLGNQARAFAISGKLLNARVQAM